MKTILRLFFRLLYHQFAFTYDLVAATVSFNRWKSWVMSVIQFIEGKRILEIGHGPGHLQRLLLSRNLFAIGIDESAQMGRLAKRNLMHQASSLSAVSQNNSLNGSVYTQFNLIRGIAQHLPFPNASFDTIVATFPTEYITDPHTLCPRIHFWTGFSKSRIKVQWRLLKLSRLNSKSHLWPQGSSLKSKYLM